MVCRRSVVAVPIVALLAAACSGSSGTDQVDTEPTRSPTTTEASATAASAAPSTSTPTSTPPSTTPAFADGPLAEVCGDSIVVQASNFADAGSGPLYALLGATPMVDLERQAVSAPLTRADGTVEDVTLEIRSGGPAVAFRSPIAVMADDDTIDLALASTAVAVRDRSVLETHAVAALTDSSRDAVIIDPATYPEVTDLATLGTQGIEVRHVTDAPMIRYLVATGVLSPDQLTAGSDGLPASFVEAGGLVTQQGDLTVEPVLLPSLQQWSRPVTALPATDAGWLSLDDVVLTDADSERVPDDCLGRLVRLIQQSIVAYTADPAPTNVVMSDVRGQFNPLARLTPLLLDFGTQLAIDADVFDLNRADAPGTIAVDGLDGFLVDLAAALDVESVSVDDLVDSRFVDQSISR